MKKIALVGLVMVAVAAVVTVVASSTVTRDGVGIRTATACAKQETPECLPKLEYMDTEGTFWTDEALAGKVIMVNFWATWCAPCKHEVPALTAAFKKYQDQGFVLLGMMVDDPDDAELASFASRYHLDYPVVRLDQEIMNAFDSPRRLPATFIYDRGGTLRLHREGAVTEAEVAEIVEELLAEKPAP